MINDPMMLDLPDEFETERLILRPPRLGDGDVIHAAIEASRPELTRWMPWAGQDRDGTERYVRVAVARWITRETTLPLTIWRKADGAFIGGAGFHSIEWHVPLMEMGYWIATEHTGKGYTTEAVNGEVALARKHFGVLRLEIYCEPENLRSAAVARRCGFEQWAHIRNSDRVNGRLRDLLAFCKVWNEDDSR